MEQLAISSVAIAFLVNVFTSVMKTWVYPRFGKFGVQVVAFIFAVIGAWYVLYGQNIASLENIVAATIALFTLAVTIYEVILQHIPSFKGTDPEVIEARHRS